MELEKRCNRCGHVNTWNRFKWAGNAIRKKEHNRKNSTTCPKCGSNDVSSVEDEETMAAAGFVSSLLFSSPKIEKIMDTPPSHQDAVIEPKETTTQVSMGFKVNDSVEVRILGRKHEAGTIQSVHAGSGPTWYLVRIEDGVSPFFENEIHFPHPGSQFLFESKVPLNSNAKAGLVLHERSKKTPLRFTLTIEQKPTPHDSLETISVTLSEDRLRALIITAQLALDAMGKSVFVPQEKSPSGE